MPDPAIVFTKHPQEHVTVLSDLRLRYIDVPAEKESGEPPLLLLHGLASRIEEYEELVLSLRKTRRVIVPDLPGNGYSDKPCRSYSLTFLEDAVLGLLDHLQIDRANVAGGSLGGNLTLRLGHREPERFQKLAAWAPAGAWEPMRFWPQLMRLLPEKLLFWPTLKIQSRFWYHPKWAGKKKALENAFAHFRDVYCAGFVRMYSDLGFEQVTTSLFPIAERIKQPTLLLWGDQDHGLNMGKGVLRLSKMIPRARLVVFKDARHSLANEIPGALGDAVEGFLANNEADAKPKREPAELMSQLAPLNPLAP